MSVRECVWMSNTHLIASLLCVSPKMIFILTVLFIFHTERTIEFRVNPRCVRSMERLVVFVCFISLFSFFLPLAPVTVTNQGQLCQP